MTIAACEEQIIRIKRASVQPEINEALDAELRKQVRSAVQTTVEGALEAELAEDLADRTGEKPRRSGFFRRVTDSQYGRNPELRVPKLAASCVALVYSTYLGGTEEDWGVGIAMDQAGNVCITGLTRSRDLAPESPLQGVDSSGQDAFVAKIITPVVAVAEPVAQLLRSAEADGKSGRWEGAIASYRTFLERFPSHPRAAEAHLRLGHALSYTAGKTEEPMAEYIWAIELAQERWIAHDAKVALGGLHYAVGEYVKARDLLLEVVGETTDWKLVKYITYRMKDLDRQMMATKQ